MARSRPRTNGVGTATFRRPSLATSNSQSSLNQTNNSAAPYNPGTYVPPHHYQNSSARNGSVAESRFSKEQLLGLYKSQKDAGDLGKNVADLFVGGWTPGGLGLGSGPTWNKREDNAKENGPNVDICWEAGGDVVPLGLTELTEQEKEVRVFWVSLVRAIMLTLLLALLRISQFDAQATAPECQ